MLVALILKSQLNRSYLLLMMMSEVNIICFLPISSFSKVIVVDTCTFLRECR